MQEIKKSKITGVISMYLSLLKENNKQLFLKLAYNVSLIDGNIGIEEQQMIDNYCQEMNISNINYTDNISLEDISSIAIKECNTLERKIIIFELIGLSMSDEHYDEKEKDYVFKLSGLFYLDVNYCIECEKLISNYILLQNNINQLVIS